MTTETNKIPIEQPKPQPLPARPIAGASILVSTRQKGNPILSHIKGLPWEFSDIPADFVLGATTCALFLSLKYHKLHPEYVYGRIRALQGKYHLRILLTLVDVETHEESLKELSKTSLFNNVTVVLAWSAQEAGRYLELFKTYEHASATSIKGHQSTSFVDRMMGFVATPMSVNKNDAISLVSNFSTIRTAVNAQPEDISLIAGWGGKKVKRWTTAVREPFRTQCASKKVLYSDVITTDTGSTIKSRQNTQEAQPEEIHEEAEKARDDEEEEPMFASPEIIETSTVEVPVTRKRPAEPEVDDGVMAALAKLRQKTE